jgi:MFS transporter, CP family, cyanate transporter
MMAKIDERIESSRDEPLDGSHPPFALLMAGIILLALNLRSSITSVGPLLEMIRSETGLSDVAAGLLNTLPLLAFAVFSPLAPALGRRWGMEKVLLASLVILTAGILLRSVPGLSLLFAGTALLGLAIALGNVLLPGLIKRDFPRHVGLMTGVYSTVMGVGAALAAGVSVPLARVAGSGWRGSLAFWALPAAFAAVIWLLLRRSPSRRTASQVVGVSGRLLLRSPLAWQVTLYMGLQSLTFYITIAWFPTIFQSEGLSAASAGWMVALLQLFGVLGSFLTPLLAVRMRSQRAIVAVAIVCCLISYVGLLTSSTALIPLWCAFNGLGQGAYISLALMFFILRTRDSRSASGLSGMAQSIGYLLAALGPLLFGLLHDLTRSWTIPLLALVIVTLGLFAVGLGAGRAATIAPRTHEEEDLATP